MNPLGQHVYSITRFRYTCTLHYTREYNFDMFYVFGGNLFCKNIKLDCSSVNIFIVCQYIIYTSTNVNS